MTMGNLQSKLGGGGAGSVGRGLAAQAWGLNSDPQHPRKIPAHGHWPVTPGTRGMEAGRSLGLIGQLRRPSSVRDPASSKNKTLNTELWLRSAHTHACTHMCMDITGTHNYLVTLHP